MVGSKWVRNCQSAFLKFEFAGNYFKDHLITIAIVPVGYFFVRNSS